MITEHLNRLLRSKSRGEEVSRAEIMQATGWSGAEIDRALRDSSVSKVLRCDPGGVLRANQDGAGVSHQGAPSSRPGIRAGDLVAGESATYRLERHLGNGAIGSVWAAHCDHGHPVAIKFFEPRADLVGRHSHRDLLRRFMREGCNGTKLAHPSLIGIREAVENRERPFIVMDRADGNADELVELARPRGGTWHTAVAIAFEVAEGLGYLHAQGCVHRDVKPPNVLRLGNRWLLGDLGVVRWNDLNPIFSSAGTLTNAAVRLGSWRYMAPEQLDDPHRAVPQSDIYSLGITLYELCTGTVPSPQRVAARRIPRNTGREGIDDLILLMTEFDAKDRPGIVDVCGYLASYGGRPDTMVGRSEYFRHYPLSALRPPPPESPPPERPRSRGSAVRR